MKVLFITSLKTNNFNVSPFIESQANSLIDKGIEIDYFHIRTNSISTILNSIAELKKIKSKYNIIHAHYSTNGFFSLLAGTRKKLVISYLGSDLLGINNSNGTQKKISKLIQFISFIVSIFSIAIIVKSEQMKKKISSKFYKNTHVIPNGIDFDKFFQTSQKEALEELNLDSNNKNILFLGNTKDTNKNYNLAKQAFQLLPVNTYNLISPYPVSPSKIPVYLNAADVLLLTSISEGSSNVIKEALACNTPIVTVNAGDAAKNIEDVSKTFLVDYNPQEIAKRIENLCQDSNRTNGRDLINHLEISNIADRIISVYKTVSNV